MKIEKLNNKEHLDVIINWFFNWWSDDKDKSDIRKEIIDPDNVIVNKVLLENEEIIGVYQLLKKDKIDYKNSKCWLANIYIREDKRKMGYGKFLIEDSIKEAKKLGFNKLYLHSKHEGLYEKFGFELIDKVQFNGKIKRIFSIDL